MWNWMASSLFAGAAIVCFDGFAAYPKLSAPWDLVERERVTHLGTSPRFLQAGRKRVKPIEDNNLSALRVIFSTGSPLMPEDFEYVYTRVKEARITPTPTLTLALTLALALALPLPLALALPLPLALTLTLTLTLSLTLSLSLTLALTLTLTPHPHPDQGRDARLDLGRHRHLLLLRAG